MKNKSMGIVEGWSNYLKNTEIKESRLEAVKKCKHAVPATISALRLKDDNPSIDGMICDDCFCPLPTKLRQDKIKCKCWNEE